MPGIEKSRVVGKEEDELDEFICGICQHIFDEPVVTQCCRQSYCKVCINQWLENHNTCPNDRENLTVGQLLPASRMVINLLSKLKIKCENYGTDCQTVLTIEEMVNHMKTCNTCDSCKTSKKLLSDKQNEIQSLKSENGKLKKALGQSTEELRKINASKKNQVILFQIMKFSNQF